MTLSLTLPKTLTPWVNMNPYAKFGLDRPTVWPAIGNRQTDKQTNKHIAFYYVDRPLSPVAVPCF